jgi:Protein of unknown function (DUF2735)
VTEGLRTGAADNFAASRIGRVASGGGWYHEEAIQKAERARKL